MSLDFDSARLPNPHLTELHHAWRAQLRKFIDTFNLRLSRDIDMFLSKKHSVNLHAHMT